MAVNNTHFKGSWRPEEDAALREAVSRHGEKNWSTVARTFNQLMGRPPLLGRAPKQCRSRYLQQLVPGIKTGEWSVEEEEILVEGHKQFGNQWTLIASMLPGRTETSVKNHYNCTARRKVPSDPNRMTILQRYLAVIGVITPPGSKGSSSKYPSLGRGYPNSSNGMYFQTNSAAAAAAAAAAAVAAKAAGRSSSRRGTSAPAPTATSPSGSHLGYDEYEAPELAHAYSEADFNQAYAAYQAYQEQQHHMAAAAAAAAAAVQDHDAEGEDEVAAEGGAVDGLLQLAHAAMLHLEEMAGDAEEEEEEGAGSGSGEGQHSAKGQGGNSKDHDMTDAAAGEAYGDSGHQADPRHQEQDLKDVPDKQQPEVAPAASKASGSSKSPAGRSLPGWLKPEMAMSVMSSEESDRTAEEPDDGSPLAEQLLRQHLKSGIKRGSPTTAAPVRGQPAGAPAPSKRPRSTWGPADDVAAATDATAGAGSAPRFNRPVLDVSEPEGASSCVPPPLSLAAVDPASPAVPSVTSTTASMSDLNSHLVAMLMGAFMGAADSTAASAPAAALPPDALAAIARVMATSMSTLQHQQQPGAAAAPAAAAQQPVALASRVSAKADA